MDLDRRPKIVAVEGNCSLSIIRRDSPMATVERGERPPATKRQGVRTAPDCQNGTITLAVGGASTTQ